MSATRTPTRPAGRGRRPTVVDSPDRFEGPSLSRRRRRRVRALALVMLVTVLATAVWALGWSDVLGVRTVEVTGEHRASERLIDLTADVEPGTPLARVDTGAVVERLRSLRVVEDATVERVWPHTLRITVVERTGAAVARDGDTLRLVDRSGVAFAQVPQRPAVLPFLDLDLATTDPAVVTTALAVVDGLPDPIARQVASVQARTRDDVRLRLRSGSVVLWGDESAGEQKAEVLQALLRHPAERYDVRAPQAPTTTG